LKNIYLAMTAIEKLGARQQARVTYIKAGDANDDENDKGQYICKRRKRKLHLIFLRHCLEETMVQMKL
jgi:hypothetical protein